MDDNTSIPAHCLPSQGGFLVNPRARKRIVPVARPTLLAVQPRSRRSSFRKADVTRAISAATKAGLVATRVDVTAEGTIRVFVATVDDHDSLFDQWNDRL